MSNSQDSVEEYLNKKIRPIIEALAEAVVQDEPEDPHAFMIQWLQVYSGQRNIGDVNSEKKELQNLRKELKKLEAKYKHHDDECGVESASDNEPDEDQDQVDELISINAKRGNQQKARSSVSAEVYGFHNQKKEFVAKVNPKKDDQFKRLEEVVKKSFIFNNLDENELKTVLDAVEEARFKVGDKIITEGERGDVLFIVEKGELNCTKVLKKGESPTFLKTYNEGDSFGELALLYNAQRAATITAKTNAILWTLDSETFNHIVKDAAIKKREQYEEFLKGMEILKDINPYELSQICDALKSHTYNVGEKIINEAEDGDQFYIVAEGESYAEKIPGPGQPAVKVKDYKKGDYFGELALLKNEPRAASVIASSKCKLLSLDRRSFKRLLGPVEDILKRCETTYVKFLNK
jgi:cAMP-dependent protein kinase regulator